METQQILDSIRKEFGMKESPKKIKDQADFKKIREEEPIKFARSYLEIEAEYIRKTERYRNAINKSTDIQEIARLGIECIAELAGDKLFLKHNLKKME